MSRGWWRKLFSFDALHFIVMATLWTVGTFIIGQQWGIATMEVKYENNKKID